MSKKIYKQSKISTLSIYIDYTLKESGFINNDHGSFF